MKLRWFVGMIADPLGGLACGKIDVKATQIPSHKIGYYEDFKERCACFESFAEVASAILSDSNERKEFAYTLAPSIIKEFNSIIESAILEIDKGTLKY